MSSGLAEIRGYLVKGESAESWLGICEVLEGLEEASEREMLVEYASQHTAGWGDSIRRPLYGWWERKQRGEQTEYEDLVGDWSIFMWSEGKVAGEARIVPYLEGMRMRWIPAGTFWMGADYDDGADDGEVPKRQVTISRGFWMMETPVTQGQYQAIMAENPSSCEDESLKAPVEGVTWYDAAAFANRLSVLEGVSESFVGENEDIDGVGNKGSDYLESKGWRLPTEAEWEYACWAGTTTLGYEDLDKIAWYEENSAWMTHPVGEKEANAWGVYDMLGNVLEWCYDGYDEAAYRKLGDVDPVCAEYPPFRVMRGGGWSREALHVRPMHRDWNTPSRTSDEIGFRLVRSGL